MKDKKPWIEILDHYLKLSLKGLFLMGSLVLLFIVIAEWYLPLYVLPAQRLVMILVMAGLCILCAMLFLKIYEVAKSTLASLEKNAL